MENKQLRPIMSMGMFDLFKGVSLALVIIGHSMEYVDLGSTISRLWEIIGNLFLFGFFIVTGFGIKKLPFGKLCRKLKKMFLAPYLITAVVMSVLFFIVHYTLFKSVGGSILETAHVFAGSLLGQYPTTHYFGFLVYSCGPLWFVVALIVGWMLMDLILHIVSEELRICVVAACLILGSTVCTRFVAPFCLNRVLSAVPGLYTGYLAKKYRFFERKPSFREAAVFVVGIVCLFFLDGGKGLSVSGQEYPLGPISLAGCCVVSLLLIFVFTRINRRSNCIVNFFEWIGEHSFAILCLHTIEYYAAHWYYFAGNRSARPVLTFVQIIVLRCAFIALGMIVIQIFKNRKEIFAVESREIQY